MQQKDSKVPYTNDGAPPPTRGAYMRLERREKNILVMQEQALRATWRTLESLFDKFMACGEPDKDTDLLERFSEVMKQFRKERDAYLVTQTRVEKTIDGQIRRR